MIFSAPLCFLHSSIFKIYMLHQIFFLLTVAVFGKRIYNYSVVSCQDSKKNNGEIINGKFSTGN